MEQEKTKKTAQRVNKEISVIGETWRRVRKDRGIIRREEGFGMFKENYWDMTRNISVNLDTGRGRKNNGMTDDDTEVVTKYGLQRDDLESNFTDGSKIEEGKATGAAVYEETGDTGIVVSLHTKCSIFTAEMVTINLALRRAVENKSINGDIIIFSDSKSALQNMEKNDINVYKNLIRLRQRDGTFNCLHGM